MLLGDKIRILDVIEVQNKKHLIILYLCIGDVGIKNSK